MTCRFAARTRSLDGLRFVYAIIPSLLFVVSLEAQIRSTAGSANAPALSFGAKTVTVSNLQPGSNAVVFALGLVPDGYQSTVVRWAQVIPDTNRSGSVQFDAGQTLPCKLIFVATDVKTGEYVIAAPPGCPLRTAAPDPQPLKRNAAGEVDTFVRSRPYLDCLYVLPGRGAWTIKAAHGYDTDDGTSHGVTVSLAHFKPLGDVNGNPDLKPGGILFAIDFYSLDIATLRLDQQTLDEVKR